MTIYASKDVLFSKVFYLQFIYSPTQKTLGLSLGMNAQGEREGIKRGTASEEFRSSSRETPGFKPGELHSFAQKTPDFSHGSVILEHRNCFRMFV